MTEGPREAPRHRRHGFKGTVPKVACRDWSGADCDEVFSADQPHCGNPDHVAAEPIERGVDRPSQARSSIEWRRGDRRHDDGGSTRPDIDRLTFNPSHIYVGRRALQTFSTHHGGPPADALIELRTFAGWATSVGTYTRSRTGLHSLKARSFTVHLTPDAEALVSYSTLHFERTPTEVFEGVPSRFRKSSSRRKPVDRTRQAAAYRAFMESHRVGDTVDGVVEHSVNFGTFVELAPDLTGLLHRSQYDTAEGESPYADGHRVQLVIRSTDDEKFRVELGTSAELPAQRPVPEAAPETPTPPPANEPVAPAVPPPSRRKVVPYLPDLHTGEFGEFFDGIDANTDRSSATWWELSEAIGDTLGDDFPLDDAEIDRVLFTLAGRVDGHRLAIAPGSGAAFVDAVEGWLADSDDAPSQEACARLERAKAAALD